MKEEKKIKGWAVIWKGYFFACPTRKEVAFFKDWIEDFDRNSERKPQCKNGQIVPCEIKINPKELLVTLKR